MSLCPSGYVPFQDKCYRIFQQPMPFLEAQNVCKRNGNGNLVEIKNQFENDFLSSHAMAIHSAAAFWTGGVTTSVAGLKFGVWFGSQDPIDFNKFYSQSESSQSTGVVLGLHNDYYYWFSKNLSMDLPFICEAPFKDIGCLQDHGADYQGNASRTEFGQDCLPWNAPGLTPMFSGQSGWNHNYCR